MYTDVTLKADDFKAIHNALWSLQYGNGDLNAQVEVIREALKDAYEQDRKTSDELYAHYKSVKNDLGLGAIWAMYEVKDLNESHPYKGIKTVTYKDHFGETEDGEDIGPVVVKVNGFTWASLYVAANAAIRDSGDKHHVYIENFHKVGDTLVLTTGS